MSSEIGDKIEKEEPEELVAIESAAGNMAAHFLKENKENGDSLTIPSLGIRLKADGSVESLNK